MATPRPLLVTGVPRSGTTWLARELASATRAALPGREPMNPRAGQFALGGTLTSWSALRDVTPRQARVLRRAYSGREVRTFSRYGIKQWAAPLPWTTVVVKDPFALLAVPTVVRETSAVPIVVYRHPGAVLASYRRVGWTAGAVEVRRLQGLPDPEELDDVAAMVEFWCYMHARVLDWLDAVPDCLIVSHAELALAGAPGLAALRNALGLAGGPRSRRAAPAVTSPPEHGLHRFERAPLEVAEGWRERLSAAETEALTQGCGTVLQSLERHRLQVLP